MLHTGERQLPGQRRDWRRSRTHLETPGVPSSRCGTECPLSPERLVLFSGDENRENQSSGTLGFV